MAKQIMAIISIVIFLILTSLALRAWRRRAAEQVAQFSAPLEALDYFGELLVQAKAFYVATTFATNHLERINAYGLGSRGIAQLFVFSEGLLIVRNGERPLAIDRADLQAVQFTQVAIDKAVEPDGLVSVSWNHHGHNFATQIRIVDSGDRASIANGIAKIIQSQTKREEVK